MRPGWPRFASVHSYALYQRGLVVASFWSWLRIRGRGWEWPGVAKLLIQLHLVAFRCISYRPNPHPPPSPSGRRNLSLRGNDRSPAESGETFISLPFASISTHPLSSEPSSSAFSQREKGSEPSRARRPSNAITTYAINVRAGAAMGQWAVVVIRAGALGWRASWERAHGYHLNRGLVR